MTGRSSALAMNGRRNALAFTAVALALAFVAVNWGLGPALAQGRTWTTQVTLSDLRSITCAGTSDCWAVGSNSTAPEVYHTSDGGQNWAIQTVANPIGYLQSVYCQSDGLHCWAAGIAEAGTGAAGVIYSTTNGGATWPGALVTSITDATRINAIACPAQGPSDGVAGALRPAGGSGGRPPGQPAQGPSDGVAGALRPAGGSGGRPPGQKSLGTAVTCIAVGNTGTGFEASTGAALLVSGDLSSVQAVAVPSGVAALTGIACQGSSDCVATGLRSQNQNTGVLSGTLLRTTNGGQSWATTKIPADVSGLAGVACPPSGACDAVGYAAPSGGAPQAVVISGGPTASSWQTEAHPSGVDYLDGIACPAAGSCLAAGYTGVGAASTAQLAWTANGTSWSTQSAGAGYLNGVACPAAGTCWAAGYQALGGSGSGGIDALTMGGTAGSWTVDSQVALGPRVGLTGVSCADKTDCVAVGNSASGPVILASSDGVTWRSETPPSRSGVLYHLDAVACPSKLDCVAVGYEVVNGSSSVTKTAISTSTTDGTTWSPVTVLSGVSHFDGVTCPSTTRCLAAGTDITNLAGSGLTGVIDTTTNLGGTWSPTSVPATVGYLTGVSCAPASSTCAAVGGTPSGAPTVLTTTTGASWTAQTLPGLPNGGTYADLNAVSCPVATSCSAVGDQLVLANGAAEGEAVILSGSGSGLGTWSLQTAPAGTGPLRGVSCATAATCEAVGTTITPDVGTNDPAGPTTTAVSTSNGTNWAADTLPNDVPLLHAVSCVAGTSSCWAAGTSSIVAAG